MESYHLLLKQHSDTLTFLQKRYNQVSVVRFVLAFVFAGSVYYYLKTDHWATLLTMGLSIVFFAVLVVFHQKIALQKDLETKLVCVNKEEIDFLKYKTMPFADGVEFNDASHPYANDLDIFGKHSLYQYLNRTATYMGQTKLAKHLLDFYTHKEIADHQLAVKELSPKIAWRQLYRAYALTANDSPEAYEKLLYWSKQKASKVSPWLMAYAYLSPILLVLVWCLFVFTSNSVFSQLGVLIFVLNLLVLALQLKDLKAALIQSEKIHHTLQNYGMMLEQVEAEAFESSALAALKSKLYDGSVPASDKIKQLSRHFAGMESLYNAMGALLFNGMFLYHIHVFKALQTWKVRSAGQIPVWLETIGAIEALSSLSNYAYNHPDHVFPALNTEFKVVMKDLGHPLISPSKRVDNDIAFDTQHFVILTGSNMSGKSTFLRALGVNMVLAMAGAPICASSANIHPLKVLASMRLSDSLSENESYFFAEIKRLKLIMQSLENAVCFVLLDEILRGTNSDDKRNGTVEVIKKMLNKNAIGIIATHDIEVCKTADEYPQQLSNKCFEVEIKNEELSFDYKLREGICRNKSASFLMKKMEII